MNLLGSRGDARTLPLVLVTPVIVIIFIMFYVFLGQTLKDVGRDSISGELSKQEAQRVIQEFLEVRTDGAPRYRIVAFLEPKVVAGQLSAFLNERSGESANVREASCTAESGGMTCLVKVRVRMPYRELLSLPFGNPMFFLRVAGYGLREEFVRSEFVLPILLGDQPGVFVFKVQGEREVELQGESL